MAKSVLNHPGQRISLNIVQIIVPRLRNLMAQKLGHGMIMQNDILIGINQHDA